MKKEIRILLFMAALVLFMIRLKRCNDNLGDYNDRYQQEREHVPKQLTEEEKLKRREARRAEISAKMENLERQERIEKELTDKLELDLTEPERKISIDRYSFEMYWHIRTPEKISFETYRLGSFELYEDETYLLIPSKWEEGRVKVHNIFRDVTYRTKRMEIVQGDLNLHFYPATEEKKAYYSFSVRE